MLDQLLKQTVGVTSCLSQMRGVVTGSSSFFALELSVTSPRSVYTIRTSQQTGLVSELLGSTFPPLHLVFRVLHASHAEAMRSLRQDCGGAASLLVVVGKSGRCGRVSCIESRRKEGAAVMISAHPE